MDPRSELRRAQDLLREGRSRCRVCGEEAPLDDHVQVRCRGLVLFAVCPRCVACEPIVIRRREDQIEIVRAGSDRIVVQPDAREITRFAASTGGAHIL